MREIPGPPYGEVNEGGEARRVPPSPARVDTNAPISPRTEGLMPTVPNVGEPRVAEVGLPHIAEHTRAPKFAETYMGGQAKIVRKYIERIGLDLPVQDTAEEKDAGFFRDRKTYAYTAMNEIPLAIMASSEAPGQDISVLLITPKEDESGILTDPTTGRFFSDSFWMVEDGVVKHIRPTQPVPIDHLAMEFDPDREDIAAQVREQQETMYRFDDLTYDKERVKELMAQAGIAVPRGIFIEGGDIDEVMADFDAASTMFHGGIVFKENEGSGGVNVTRWDTEDPTMRERFLDVLGRTHNPERSYVVEELIRPKPNAEIARLVYDEYVKGDPTLGPSAITANDVDYNFRILTTLGEDPEVIDAEVRFQHINAFPINVAKNAFVARLDVLKDPELVIRLEEAAKKMTAAVYGEVSGGRTSEASYCGVDLMLSADDEIVGIEVNSFRSGGFSSLTKVDGQPLAGISEIALPAFAPALEESFVTRPVEIPAALERVGRSQRELFFQIDIAEEADDFAYGADVVYQVTQDYPSEGHTKWARWYFENFKEEIGDTPQLARYTEAFPPMTEQEYARLVPQVTIYQQPSIEPVEPHEKRRS